MLVCATVAMWGSQHWTLSTAAQPKHTATTTSSTGHSCFPSQLVPRRPGSMGSRCTWDCSEHLYRCTSLSNTCRPMAKATQTHQIYWAALEKPLINPKQQLLLPCAFIYKAPWINEHGHHCGNFSKYKGHSNDLILILKRHLLTHDVYLNVFLARVTVNKKDFHLLIPIQILHLAAVLSKQS